MCSSDLPRHAHHVDQIDPARILDACRDRLARYEIPEDITFVERIPHTPKGAIDRTAALAAYARTDSSTP